MSSKLVLLPDSDLDTRLTDLWMSNLLLTGGWSWVHFIKSLDTNITNIEFSSDGIATIIFNSNRDKTFFILKWL